MGPPDEDVQVEEDIGFQRLNWRVQRAGWFLTAGLLTAALLGAFGNGPLATTSATSTGGSINASYEQIVRRSAPTSIYLSFTAPRPGAPLVVRLSRRFVEAVELLTVVPEPIRMSVGEQHVAYEFAVEDAAGKAHAVFSFHPRAMGRQLASFAIEGGENLELRQFVFP